MHNLMGFPWRGFYGLEERRVRQHVVPNLWASGSEPNTPHVRRVGSKQTELAKHLLHRSVLLVNLDSRLPAQSEDLLPLAVRVWAPHQSLDGSTSLLGVACSAAAAFALGCVVGVQVWESS